MKIFCLLLAILFFGACDPSAPSPEVPESEPVEVPPEAEPIEPEAVDTMVPRLHVLEDIRASGNVVSIRFRPGWDIHDSIQARTSSGSLIRSGLSWRLDSPRSALVTIQVCQKIADNNGKIRDVCPEYETWVQIGPMFETAIPSEIDSTGDTDVCSANDNRLEAWLSTIPNGSIIRAPEGSRYRCDYGIELFGRWNLVFSGRTTLFTDYDASRDSDSNRRQFRNLSFDRGGNITIRGWNIEGPRRVGDSTYIAVKETQHGIEFNGTNGVVLDSVSIKNVYGDLVCLCFSSTRWGEGLHTSEPTRHVTITNGTFSNAGRQGFGITGLFDAKISGNTFSEIQRSLFDFEPGSRWDWVQDVEVFQNRVVGRIGNYFVAGHGQGMWMQNITIRDNDLGPKPFGITFGGNIFRKNIQILRNIAYSERGSPLSPIEISGIDSLTIVGNVMPMQARRRKPAILIQNQRHWTDGNTIEGNTAKGSRVMWRWEEDKRDPGSVIIEDGKQVYP